MPNSTPISTQSADHYSWGEGCDGWHLVRTPDLSVIEERMPPGTSENRHFHTRARQFFYVLDGELHLELEGTTHILTTRNGLEILPGQSHLAMNHGDQAVRFLVVSQPASHGDRVPAPAA